MSLKKKILVVDDEDGFISTAKDFFTARRYQVITARDGVQALEKMSERPDLVLLDLMMPGMSGLDVLHKLRSDESQGEVPVVIVTAKAETESIFEAQRLRATDYVIKPVSLENLFNVIERYLDDRRRKPV